jgi:peptide/nickel transport system permease protein
MANFLIRRIIQIVLITLVAAFISYVLFYLAPGGPLSQLREIQQGGRTRLDPGAVDRVMKRGDLDLYHIPRFMRWLVGEPRGPIVINGQEMFGGTPIGCLQEGRAQLVYADGSVVETNCIRPVYLRDLADPQRRVSNGVLRGDFGVSQQILRDRPVMDLLRSRILPTLLLMGISSILALVIAIPIGVISAVKQYSRFDYIVTTLTFFGSSMPTLFLGIMGILIFSLTFKDLGLPYLPPQLATSNADATVPLFGTIQAESLADRIWHLILPVTVLTLVSLTGWTRFIRSSMLEVLRQDYVRTARAKGLVERLVISKHAFRNALIPFITLAVGIIPALFGGAIITETIFSWPGLGRLFYDSLTRSDYTVSMAILLISTILTLFSFLLADILYTVVDPRIRLS